ncbi:NACHT domain-containing protein [Fusarium globosum]|uniref:NACHT domain-containing protein n=1 Tax=Fusarium globosum TaxID=78864 RepID=A0A8H5YH25_9HYPO|nr:NACHT domain-containing protein [Fusarium globosum]
MSGLEPLAALGLVCNIVQLVEVGLKTATLYKNAYRTGEPDPELSVYAQNLTITASSLSQSLEDSQQPLNLSDSRLLTLARNCRDAEAEWRNKTPARFLSRQQPRKRDRLGAVFRGIINKPEIYRLEIQLQKARESLETGLLVGIFQRLDVSKLQANDLQDKFRDLLQATSTSEKKLHGLIQAQVALVNMQISDRIDQAEASTKTHVTTELASYESRLKSHADHAKDIILTEAGAREYIRRENEAYEWFLRSFQYPDMNHRRNEIHASYGSTFNWLFEGKFEIDHLGLRSEASRSYYQSESRSRDEACSYPQELARSSFVGWLKSPEARYWISGHPGTGKSVLMKFIVSHERTIASLRQWQPEVRIIAHFFWKVGSHMQSSFKGFLCSLLYQLFSSDKEHAMSCLKQNPDWSRKAGPSDWDTDGLQFLIHSYARYPARPFCLFIDGLDELMDDEGAGILIDFLNTLQDPPRLFKICMSSRPESAIRMRLGQNPDIKMQDLTRNDIRQYARANLKKEVSLTNSSMCIEDLVTNISDKAEGVFLWAVLVTRSIARGISNGDSREIIQKRLWRTPKKLYELYLDMWTRLGEDTDLYQYSTALIFKIFLFAWQSSHRALPLDVRLLIFSPGLITILELMLASSDDLWSTSFQECDKLSATDLEQRCEELLTRLPFITADLFEVVQAKDHERSGERQSADKPHSPAIRYDNLGVEAVHRTVFDFLIETEDGKRIIRHHKGLPKELFIRTFRSRLLRNCLCPEVRYSSGESEEDRNWLSAWRHLDIQLHLLSYHTDIIYGSTLVELLDLLWAAFIQMTKSLTSHPGPSSDIVKRIYKLDYLLRIVPYGFDAYITEHLAEWESTQQFEALYKFLIACLESDGFPCSDFEWAGKQRLMQRILSIIVSDKFHVSTPSGQKLSSDTLVKASIAHFLISAVDTFRILQHSTYPASSWDAERTSVILGMIRDFRHSLCLGDHMLVTLFLKECWMGVPNLVSCRRNRNNETAVYVEISMSILIQIFLQQVVQNDANFNRHEVEDALNLKDCPQTIKPTMLGVGDDFLELSSTELPILQRYCQRRLLPGLFSPSDEDLEDMERFEERLTGASRHMFKRERRMERPAGTESGIEGGAGLNGMNFYLCSSCETGETT